MKRFMMYTYSILVNDQISDDVGMVWGSHMWEEKMHMGFLWENVKEWDDLEDLYLVGI
jgi:hypothetical protein